MPISNKKPKRNETVQETNARNREGLTSQESSNIGAQARATPQRVLTPEEERIRQSLALTKNTSPTQVDPLLIDQVNKQNLAKQQEQAQIDTALNNLSEPTDPTIPLRTDVSAIDNPSELAQVGSAIAGGFISGSVAGAGVGATGVGLPIAPLLPIGGALIGGYLAVAKQLTGDKKQILANAIESKSIVKNEQTEILNRINQGSITPEEAVLLFRQNEANALEGKRALKTIFDEETGKGYDKAEDELLGLQHWIDGRARRERDLLIALQNPNPLNVQIIQKEEVTQEPEGFFSL